MEMVYVVVASSRHTLCRVPPQKDAQCGDFRRRGHRRIRGSSSSRRPRRHPVICAPHCLFNNVFVGLVSVTCCVCCCVLLLSLLLCVFLGVFVRARVCGGSQDSHRAVLRPLLAFSLPVSLAYLTSFLIPFTTLIFLGSTGKDELAAGGTASMTANITAFSVCVLLCPSHHPHAPHPFSGSHSCRHPPSAAASACSRALTRWRLRRTARGSSAKLASWCSGGSSCAWCLRRCSPCPCG